MNLKEHRYNFVTAQIRYYNDKIIESFNLFVKLSTAIVGGVIWLNIQDDVDQPTRQFYSLCAVCLFAAVGAATLFGIWINLHAWWGYRQVETKLWKGEDALVPELRRWKSRRAELIMSGIVFAAIVACFVFYKSMPA